MRTMPLKRLGKESRFRHVDHFNALVDSYLVECEEFDNAPGLAGMVLYLGLPSRKFMDKFVKENSEYEEPYARACSLIEMYLEEIVATPQPHIGGVQGLLKVHHGHQDKLVVEHTPLTVNIEGKDALL